MPPALAELYSFCKAEGNSAVFACLELVLLSHIGIIYIEMRTNHGVCGGVRTRVCLCMQLH